MCPQKLIIFFIIHIHHTFYCSNNGSPCINLNVYFNNNKQSYSINTSYFKPLHEDQLMYTTWTYQKDNSFTFSKDKDGFHLAIHFNTDEELIRDAFTPLKHPVGEHDTLIDYKDKTLDANGSLKNPSYDFYGQNVKSNKIINSSDSIVIALLLIKILYWISLNTVFKEYWHIMFSMRKLIVIPPLIGLFITNQFNYLFFIYHIFIRKNLFNPLPDDFSIAIQDVPKKDEG